MENWPSAGTPIVQRSAGADSKVVRDATPTKAGSLRANDRRSRLVSAQRSKRLVVFVSRRTCGLEVSIGWVELEQPHIEIA